MSKTQKPRVGIYAGAFDPVHSGHVAFALQAQRETKLDEVCFLPERMPRSKLGVEHFAHRVAMLKHALRPYPQFSIAELVDKNFTVNRTLPQLKKTYAGSQLVLLMGSDVFVQLPQWHDYRQLLKTCEIVVSIRDARELSVVLQVVQSLGVPSQKITIVDSVEPAVSSGKLRDALRRNTWTKGLLPSVHRYARRAWLYTSAS